jgi:hypothetical protein
MSFRLQRERDPERIRALLDLSGTSFALMYGSLLLLILAGIVAGFMGRWWDRGWIWTAIGLFLTIGIGMGIYGQRHYHQLRRLVGLPYMEGSKERPAEEPASQERIEERLTEGRPVVLTIMGFGGFAVILWLMMFKPF